MRQRFTGGFFLMVALATASWAAPVLTGEQAAKMAVAMPPPDYPLAARVQHLHGKGRFLVHIRVRTGLVRQVDVEQSTGSAILDSATIANLKKWRFKPGALPTIKEMGLHGTYPHPDEDSLIRVPISFSLQSAANSRGDKGGADGHEK